MKRLLFFALMLFIGNVAYGRHMHTMHMGAWDHPKKELAFLTMKKVMLKAKLNYIERTINDLTQKDPEFKQFEQELCAALEPFKKELGVIMSERKMMHKMGPKKVHKMRHQVKTEKPVVEMAEVVETTSVA